VKRKHLMTLGGIAILLVLAVAWEWGRGDTASIVNQAPRVSTPEYESSTEVPEHASDREEVVASVAADVETAPTLMSAYRVTGRVVDEGRYPVIGARVTLALTGESAATGISGPAGSFELSLRVENSGGFYSHAVIARTNDGRSALGVVAIPEAEVGETLEVDAGTLVLGRAHSLRVKVRMDQAPAPEADVSLAVGHERVPAGEFVTDSKGDLELSGLPAGVVHLRAKLGEHGGYSSAFLPEQHEALIALDLVDDVDVQVISTTTGAALPGVTLTVNEEYFAPSALRSDPTRLMEGESLRSGGWSGVTNPTDAEGFSRIEGLSPGMTYRLTASGDGYKSGIREQASTAKIRHDSEFVLLELTPEERRQLTWPIVSGELPVPSDGTVMHFRHLQGRYSPSWMPSLPQPCSVANSALSLDAIPNLHEFLAVDPNGALALVSSYRTGDFGSEISFRKPRPFEVRVLDPDGAEVEGVRVWLRRSGLQFGGEERLTDASGRAVYEGLYGGQAEIHVRAPKESRLGAEGGHRVDLESGEDVLEIRLEQELARRVRGRLAVTIDRAPRLPGRFQLRARGGVEIVEELPERGELVLDLNPEPGDSEIQVWLNAVGFVGATAVFPLLDDARESLASVELDRTALLIADVRPPAEGYVRIQAQFFDEMLGTWSSQRTAASMRGLSRANGPDGLFIFSETTPGVWRVLDERSGLASSPVTLNAGDPEAWVELNLAVIEWVTGTVVVDDPAELPLARVLAEGSEAGSNFKWRPGLWPPVGAWVADGTFKISVPNDRETTLVAWHPWLVPDENSGRATVRGGQDGVVLKLVEGDGLVLPQTQLNADLKSIRIARFAHGTEPKGEPLAWHHAVVEEGEVRCSIPRGNWTLLVDPRIDFQPLVLHEVAIEGMTKLPTAEFERGSTVRVRVLVPDGIVTPRIYVSARPQAAPIYDRGQSSAGEDMVLLRGLGAGRYTIKMSSHAPYKNYADRELVLDGVTDAEIELDLR